MLRGVERIQYRQYLSLCVAMDRRPSNRGLFNNRTLTRPRSSLIISIWRGRLERRITHFVGTNFICHVVAHFSSFSSTYFLRGHNMLCLPKPLTTSYGINSFSYLAATSWNSLPDHHRTISDFTSFRRLISTGNNNSLKRAGTANLSTPR